MPVGSNVNARASEYRFGAFRLVPVTHELWKDGQRCSTAPLVYGCLVYLLTNRQRVVGADELVSAVWGRVDVADAQVRQLIARARQTVEDNASEQRLIRTVAGVGYRWVGDVVLMPEAAEPERSEVAPRLLAPDAVQTGVTDLPVSDPPDAPPERLEPSVGHGKLAVSAAVFVLLMVGAIAWWHRSASMSTNADATLRATAAGNKALVVLPLVINGPDEFAWMRLGGMDLIANRMRNLDRPVPPTESVVVALRAAEKPDGSVDIDRMRAALGVGLVVSGSVDKVRAGWKVKLSATTSDGLEHRIESEASEATVAATRASDMLVASLGGAPPADVERSGDVAETLQQAQAATLAGETDTARAILDRVPAAMKGDPEVVYRRAHVDFSSGKLQESASALASLVDDSTLEVPRLLRGQALTLMAMIAFRQQDCVATEQHAREAIAVLDDLQRPSESGRAFVMRGLANTCMARFDVALDDLGRARAEAEASDDRLGVARVDSYLGKLDLQRNRPADALNHLAAADAVFASFGATDYLLRNLTEIYYAQSGLLRRGDALATSERLWTLRDRMKDPGSRIYLGVVRADALRTNGRLDEARALFGGLGDPVDGDLPAVRALNAARAELAWDRGDATEALIFVDKSLAAFPHDSGPDDASRASLLLLRQRASVATGKAQRAEIATDAPSSILLVARAEWAGHEGRSDDAERDFREAARVAESAGGAPEDVARVSQAYGRWLLGQGRPKDAAAQAGRIATWADGDFDSAILQFNVFDALQQGEARERAMKSAIGLAGERALPFTPK